MKVAVLGIHGMLGSKVLETFLNAGINTIGLARPEFDAEYPDFSQIQDCDYIINCIGVIKPYIHDNNSAEVVRAIKINGMFPHELARTGIKVIQIATDCVWDGKCGEYSETTPHNAIDVYGKTKSLGEVSANNFLNLRCSIIGREKKGNLSLLEWFLHQRENACLKGYKNHLWNGLTTNAFSKICVGIIKNNSWFSGVAHIVPADIVSKAEMLHMFAEHFNRKDIKISNINAEVAVNRVIVTNNQIRNKKLWNDGGYKQIPSIREMIEQI